MKISELESTLKRLREQHGDIDVSMSEQYDRVPEPRYRLSGKFAAARGVIGRVEVIVFD
jgi:hypothetical protein